MDCIAQRSNFQIWRLTVQVCLWLYLVFFPWVNKAILFDGEVNKYYFLVMWATLKGHLLASWRQRWLDTHPIEVGEVSWSYLFSGGKELRPQLLVCLWSILAPNLPVCSELALAIEALHAVSLVLDDLPWMDNATTRRGRPTLHCLFSVPRALLVCVDVLVMVYELWNIGCPTTITLTRWLPRLATAMAELTPRPVV